MLKQVFWIDKTKFVCDVMEATLREQKIACYTHQSAADFQFILEDLNPEVLVVDAETIQDDIEGFFKSLEGEMCSRVPIVLVGDSQAIKSIQKKHEGRVRGVINKPVAPMVISQELKKILNFLN